MNEKLNKEDVDRILNTFFPKGYLSCGEKYLGWMDLCGYENNAVEIDFECIDDELFTIGVLAHSYEINLFEIQGCIRSLIKSLDKNFILESLVTKDNFNDSSHYFTVE